MSIDNADSKESYECSHCGDIFQTERGRDSHVDQVHGRPYHDEEHLRELYVEEGMSSIDIASKYGVSDTTVRNCLRRNDITVRSTKESARLKAPDELQDGELLRQLYCVEELPVEEVADEIGCSYRRAWSGLHYHGIEMREGVLRGEDHPLWVEDSESVYYGENWDRYRRSARERDSNTCQVCGTTAEEYGMNLDVHHIRPVKSFDEPEEANKLENLITLCRPCHRKWEGIPLRPEVVK